MQVLKQIEYPKFEKFEILFLKAREVILTFLYLK